jgi:hypothetical protein
VGFVVNKVALGQGFYFFSEYSSFSLSVSFHKLYVLIFTYMLVFQEDEWAKPVNVPRKTMLSRLSGSIGLKITSAFFFFKGLIVEQNLIMLRTDFV